MTLCQTITLDFEQEIQSTRKMLERVTLNDSTRNFAPHEKSMSFEKLATHVAELPGWIKLALESEHFDLPADFKPNIVASSSALLETFERSAEEGRKAISSATDDDLKKNWGFSFAGQHVFTSPRPEVIRSFINHLVHHRAQLGVYLRMQNVPVPGMYGPSADDGWPPA